MPYSCGDHYLKVGEQVLVEVECLFDGGMVVCYKNSQSEAIRGALLQPPAGDVLPPHDPTLHPRLSVPDLKSQESTKLGTLDVHTYTCGGTGRHLTVDIARNVCRPNKNNTSSIGNRKDTPTPGYVSIGNRKDTPTPGYVSIGNRKDTLIRQLFSKSVSDEGRYCKWSASYHQPVTVHQVNTEPPHASPMDPKRRSAKIQARHKIKKAVAELNDDLRPHRRALDNLNRRTNSHRHYLRRRSQESACNTTSDPQSLCTQTSSANIQLKRALLKTRLKNLTIDLTKLSPKVIQRNNFDETLLSSELESPPCSEEENSLSDTSDSLIQVD